MSWRVRSGSNTDHYFMGLANLPSKSFPLSRQSIKIREAYTKQRYRTVRYVTCPFSQIELSTGIFLSVGLNIKTIKMYL